MMEKDLLRKKFSANPDKYYRVEIFSKEGFVRKKCPKCGGYFWTLDPDRENCPNPPCDSYGFIDNPQIRKKLDYIETWKVIEHFFKKEGHESIPSYPVVCRWFPELYFTVASIVAFQRSAAGKTTFEMPANPLIIPQSCLRFSDIPNVGITGRHMTNFVMIGQHSLYERNQGYWKDKCMELDFRLLTETFKIKPELINFMEDVWVGPAAFGYSLEYFVKGLELGNAVFTEFIGIPENYKIMDQKVIDMGAGLERFTWLSQGTVTAYDAVYGPVIRKLKKEIEYDKNIYREYAILAGGLNIDEIKNIVEAKKKISMNLGIDSEKLQKQIEPLEAIYAIADHTKTLLFAITDGALPSNVGGGYNLRVILRRALEFISRFNFNIDIVSVAELHARYLKPLFPRLREGLENFSEIIDVERKRFEETKSRGERIVEKILVGGEKMDEGKFIELYESNGISPELIERIAEDKKIKLKVPDDFYTKLSERHMTEKEDVKKPAIDVAGLPKTEPLFYKKQKEFSARVLSVIDNKYVVLDRTGFYPESGGQAQDFGFLNSSRVYDVQKFGDVIVHSVEQPGFKPGETIKGRIDWKRREQLTKHHTAIHIINGAARKILGNHVWQAGSGKTPDKAHLDITHYKSLTKKETKKIQVLANRVVEKNLPVKQEFLKRQEAEKKYGFRLYQGGAVPGKILRVVNIKGFDVEACGGTHCRNTGQVGKIIIISSERIQDGIDRLTIKAGPAAEAYLKERLKTVKELAKTVNRFSFIKLPKLKPMLKELQAISDALSTTPENVKKTILKFCTDIEKNQKETNRLRKQLKKPETRLKAKRVRDLEAAGKYIFSLWKTQAKALEKLRQDTAKIRSKVLLKKAVKNQIFEIVPGKREELIEIASYLLKARPKLTVILCNKSGDIIGMSKTRDMAKTISGICKNSGGSGGGRKEFAQGKVQIKKLNLR